MNQENRERSLSRSIGVKISNLNDYSDGFSFTVETELEAYKAAYKYKHAKNCVVSEAPNISAWAVQVYREDSDKL